MRILFTLLCLFIYSLSLSADPVITSRITDAFPIEMKALDPYPLYASATIDEPESIEKIEFGIDGVLYEAEARGEAWVYWWLPENMGAHSIKIIATGTDGSSSEKTIEVTVATPIDDRVVDTYDDALINFDGSGASRWVYQTFQLPQFVGTYQFIQASFRVSCPNVAGQCDDWDRKAWVQIKAPNGEWVEFIRYITPYGIACQHSLMVTDYASLLQGEVEFRLFIDTWGTGGWEIDLTLDYLYGTPEYLYSEVDQLWAGTFPFGNFANLQPLDTLNYSFPEDAEEAKLIIVNTGHGWGDNNSLNAAEFYRAKHHIDINGAQRWEQDLWMDCSPNPDACTGQAGNEASSRAGWCPGAMARIYEYDMNEYIDDQDITMAYVFDETYVDWCHVNFPDCVSGVTCENCDDGFNPHYEIRAHVITHSNSRVVTSDKDISKQHLARIYPNPSRGTFQIKGDFREAVSIEIHSLDGKLISRREFENGDAMSSHLFAKQDLSKGSYLVKVIVGERAEVLRWVKI